MIFFAWQHRFGAPKPTVVAGVRAIPGRWVGGFGAGGGVAPPPTTPAGIRTIFGRWVGGFGSTGSASPVPPSKKKVGWSPEWGFRHDPKDLERRLRAQRESVFNPQWLDRFLIAEEKVRSRIGKVRSAKHRAALEEAVEQTAARVLEALDAGGWAPEQLIVELEAAASAKRATASLKHAQLAIEMAQAILMEEEDIEILLLH